MIAFILALACIVTMVGCASETYKLPHDQFCYSVDGSQNYDLTADERQYIIDILNDASWINDMPNCSCDIVFYTQEQEVRYTSENGIFVDYTNKRSAIVTEEQHGIINEMLGID